MNLNIRSKLIIFAVVAIIVPLGLSALIILFQLSAFTNERSKARIESDARVSHSIFAKRQENLRSAAQSIAQSIGARGLIAAAAPAPPPAPGAKPTDQPAQPSPRGLQDFLETARRGNKVSFVVLLDSKGKVIAQHNGLPPNVDANYFKDNPLFTDINNQPQEGPRFTPRVEEAPIVEALGLKDRAAVRGVDKALFLEAAAPVMSGDSVRGVVLLGQLVNNDVSADANSGQSIVNEIKETLYKDLPQDAAAVVTLSDTIVSTNLAGSEQGGTAAGQKTTGNVGTVAEPSFNEQSFPSGDYITSFVPVTEVTTAAGTHQIGRIGVAIRQSWFTAIISRVRWTIVLVTLVALVLAVGAAIFAAAQLTKPIVELTEAANRISLGELDVPITVASKDEIGTLGEALDRMRISLKQAIERLRKR
jgi:HAMP domain-containing protein